MTEIDYKTFNIKDHGQPTPETCPHGYKWRNLTMEHLAEWRDGILPSNLTHPDTEWYPVLAPPTEKAAKPEPVKRWGVSYVNGNAKVDFTIPAGRLGTVEAHEAIDVLNALERYGVVYGLGNPMSELPPAVNLSQQHVLVQRINGNYSVMHISTARRQAEDLGVNGPVCWWYLPGSDK